eukprot:gene55000-18229_t
MGRAARIARAAAGAAAAAAPRQMGADRARKIARAMRPERSFGMADHSDNDHAGNVETCLLRPAAATGLYWDTPATGARGTSAAAATLRLRAALDDLRRRISAGDVSISVLGAGAQQPPPVAVMPCPTAASVMEDYRTAEAAAQRVRSAERREQQQR